MQMNNYKELVVQAGRRMYDEKLTVGTWGNVSARDPETGYIYLTPSGMPYHTLKESDVIVCDATGKIIEGDRKPTIEKELHVGIYKSRTDVNAVIHTHPIYSLVFATLGEEIPLIIDEAAQLLGDTVQCAEYALPGSQELADNCCAALKTSNACLLRSHGAVCAGENMDHVFIISTVLEQTAQVYYMGRNIGNPVPIDDKYIKIMQSFIKNDYGQK
jgi:L-fuculose-phosphate aldolase